MKMKAVCEATGLTDRTVRYYIDENLISPLYTENYLGRKTFDFSDADIQQLKDIAVLRKFGFSIGEIRQFPMDIPKKLWYNHRTSYVRPKIRHLTLCVVVFLRGRR